MTDSRRPESGGQTVLPADVLDVDHLSVRFGNTRVLTDLAFQVRHGTSLAIIGPNGAGKSILLKALIGSVPSEGTITWASGTRIGYVPQKLDLQRDIPITGFDLIRARARLAHESDADIFRVADLLKMPTDLLKQPIGILSGGQFERLLIAFALVGKPNVLLLDEPTAGVDEPGQEQVHELMRRLRQDEGFTIMFISHELSVVYQYATEVLCLSHQRAYVGVPKTILTPDLLQEIYGSPLGYHVHDH